MMTRCLKIPIRLPFLAALLVFALLLGCDKSARSLALDKDLARESCKSFLTAWQEGKKPADLKPKIIGDDFAWSRGDKLVGFELKSTESSDGTNLMIPASITLKDAQGVESKSDVVYVVGTSPVITIARADN